MLVKIEYQMDPTDRSLFLRTVDELGEERRRNGAFAWGIFEDMSAQDQTDLCKGPVTITGFVTQTSNPSQQTRVAADPIKATGC